MSVKEFNKFVGDVYDKVVSITKKKPTVQYQKSDLGLCFYTAGKCVDLESGTTCGEGCLIGQALLEIDNDLYDFLHDPQNEGEGIYVIMKRIADRFFDCNILMASQSVQDKVHKLEVIQSAQDMGKMWGECV